MKCSPCTEEFGTGTINCTIKGAVNCEDTHYQEIVTVNDFIVNLHCKSCNDSMPFCVKCQGGERCGECAEGYIVDEETGQCKLSPDKCRELFPNLADDHGVHCTGCNLTECQVWTEEACEDGFVFNNRKMQCMSCQEEFGNETVVCDNDGAVQC